MKLSVSKRNRPIQEIDLGKNVLAQDYSETIFLIGRSKECHIVLDDKKVSREHARIIHKSGKWFIEKTSISNACQVNGENFEHHEIESGDVFSVESYTVSFMLNDSPVESLPNSTQQVKMASSQELAASKSLEKTATDVTLNIKDIQEKKIANDPDSTGEINIDEFSELGPSDNSQSEEVGNENLDFANGDDEEPEVQSLVDQDTDVDIPLSGEDIAEAQIEDENMSYSLENIDGGEVDESTRVMQSFATVHLELFGETAPYDRYIIEKDKTYIGRDPSKCQIVLNDTEVSTVHAVIVKNNIMLTLEDLNSSNGTIHNGDRINKVMLGHNDEFVIGGVTFTVKIRSEFLKEESSTLMAVDEDQTIEVEEIVEEELQEGEQIDALGDTVTAEPVDKSLLKRIWKDEQKRKKLIYGLVVLVGLWLFLDEGEQPVPTKTAKVAQKEKKATKKPITNLSSAKLTEDQMRSLSAQYEIGKTHFNNGRYREALTELQKISAVDPNFNPSLQSLISLSKEGLGKIEEAEKERQAKLLAAERKAKVLSLLEKAREYTKERRVDLAMTTFNEITQIDPENYEVSKMKLELDDWQREKQKKELEEAQKKKDREDKVEKLKPARTLFLQNEWFKAISKLEDFLRIKDMDDDLTSEATEMLKKSKDELSSAVAPLTGKAKSLLEGQDLRGAYEVYQQILRIEPSNAEALNQVGEIKDQLTVRARKIYREAIIAESLSLFQDAKEKFQEVQQMSPVDSEYYKKATDKLKDYLD